MRRPERVGANDVRLATPLPTYLAPQQRVLISRVSTTARLRVAIETRRTSLTYYKEHAPDPRGKYISTIVRHIPRILLFCELRYYGLKLWVRIFSSGGGCPLIRDSPFPVLSGQFATIDLRYIAHHVGVFRPRRQAIIHILLSSLLTMSGNISPYQIPAPPLVLPISRLIRHMRRMRCMHW